MTDLRPIILLSPLMIMNIIGRYFTWVLQICTCLLMVMAMMLIREQKHDALDTVPITLHRTGR